MKVEMHANKWHPASYACSATSIRPPRHGMSPHLRRINLLHAHFETQQDKGSTIAWVHNVLYAQTAPALHLPPDEAKHAHTQQHDHAHSTGALPGSADIPTGQHCSLHSLLAGRQALRTSISAQACQSALLLAPGRRRVPSLNQRRASPVRPVSAASTPSAWYR